MRIPSRSCGPRALKRSSNPWLNIADEFQAHDTSPIPVHPPGIAPYYPRVFIKRNGTSMSNSQHGRLAMRGGESEPPPNPSFHLGMLSIFTTTFVGLVGHGYSPGEALAVSAIVCIGGAEIIRLLPGGGNDEPGGPRCA